MLTSFYAQLYLKLLDRIAAMVPEIRYCDQDLGQLEIQNELGRYAVSFPCLLVDFVDTVYDQLGNQMQTGTPVLQTRLAFAPFSASHSLAPEEVKKKALYYYELENKLYKALQGWDADGLCQPLTRTREASEHRDDTLRVRAGFYNTAFEDESASPEYQLIGRPSLDVEFEQS